MDVKDITKPIKNIIWFAVGLFILPIAIAALWLLIILMASANAFDGTVFEYITIYLVIFLGMFTTTGLSLWLWRVIKDVFQLTRIADIIGKYLTEQLEKFDKREELQKQTKLK